MGAALSRARFVITGICLYVLFLAATVPARMADGIANHFSDGKIRLSGAKGTLWHGSATLGILGRSSGEFSWQIKPAELFLGRLHLVLSEGEMGPADILLSPSGAELKHVSLTLPASILSLAGKPVEAFRPSGALRVKAEDFMLTDSAKGDISAEWSNADASLGRVHPLGTYQILASGTGQGMAISLATVNGPLILKGGGSWSKKDGLKFSATGESKDEGLEDLLRVIGNPMGGGVYSLKPVKF